jgi:drug/metabolite transporter (DMT)-like permease
VPSGAVGSVAVAEGAVLLAVVLWSLNYSIIKFGLSEIQPLAFPVVRFGVAGLVMLIILRVREGSIGIRREDVPVLLFMSVIGLALQQVCFMFALANTSAANVSLLTAIGPIFTALLATIFGQERLTRRHWVSIAIGVIGVTLIVRSSAETAAPSSLFGDGLAIAAQFLSSASVIPVVYLLRRYTPYRILAFQFLVGSACLAPFAATAFAEQDLAAVSVAGWASLAYAVVATGVVANLLYYRGIGRLGPSAASVIGYLQVFLGVAFAWLVLGEIVTAVQVDGGTIVVASVVLSGSGRVWVRRERPRGVPVGRPGSGDRPARFR